MGEMRAADSSSSSSSNSRPWAWLPLCVRAMPSAAVSIVHQSILDVRLRTPTPSLPTPPLSAAAAAAAGICRHPAVAGIQCGGRVGSHVLLGSNGLTAGDGPVTAAQEKDFARLSASSRKPERRALASGRIPASA